MKKQKMVVKLAVVFGLITAFAILSSCGKEKKADSDFVFKIGTANSSLCPVPLHVAIDLGIFEDEFKKAGLNYEVIEINLMDATSLVVAGKIDATLGLAGSLLPQIDNGLEIKFLSGLHTGCTKFYVKADSPYETVADLKGKTVGLCGVQDSSTVVFQRKFNDYGYKAFGPDAEFKIAVYGLTDLPLALENGAVDAVGLHDPVGYLAERNYGFRKILDTTEDEKFSQEYCCMTFVYSDIAEKYPEHTKAFVRAMLKASAYVQAKPFEAAELQIKNGHVSGDVNSNAEMLETYNYTPSVGLAKKTLYDALEGAGLTTDGKMRPGVHYVFTMTVGKKKMDNFTAAVVDWETVESDEMEPTNARITMTLLEKGVQKKGAADFDLFRASNYNDGVINDNFKSYAWDTGYTLADNKARLIEATSNSGIYAAEEALAPHTSWYWPDNKTFYHFRTVMPKTDDEWKVKSTNNSDDYITLTAGFSGSYRDVCWGAPFAATTEK